MLEIAGVVGGAVLLFTVFQWRNVKRSWQAVCAQVNKASRFLWRADPIAIYQAEIDKTAEEVQQAGEELAEYRGIISRLERDVANDEKEAERLKQIIKGLLQDGDEKKATNYVIDLQRVQKRLEKNAKLLAEKKVGYELNLKKVKYANQKIREKRDKAAEMQSDLRISKSDARVTQLNQDFKVKTSALDNLDEIEEEIQRQIDVNQAKGQVIHDLGNDGLHELEEMDRLEQQKAQLMLEQFKQELLPPGVKILSTVKNKDEIKE